MDVLGITVGPEAEACTTQLDEQRIYRAERRVSDEAERARLKQKEEQVANREHLRDEESKLYGLGIADWIVGFSNHVLFCYLCLNAFSKKSCFSNILVRLRLEVFKKSGFLKNCSANIPFGQETGCFQNVILLYFYIPYNLIKNGPKKIIL